MIKLLTTISYLYLMKAFANSLTKSRNMLEVKNREEEGWMIGMEIESIHLLDNDYLPRMCIDGVMMLNDGSRRSIDGKTMPWIFDHKSNSL
jgi:hypothetical protein